MTTKQVVPWLAASLWSAAVFAGCHTTPVDRPTLSCEQIQTTRAVELCRRMEQALAPGRRGHGMAHGYEGFWCTHESMARVYCTTPLEPGDVAILQDMSKLVGEVHPERTECAVRWSRAVENAGLPREQRNPAYAIECN